MTKKVTLIVPNDTTALIVAYQIIEGHRLISMGQQTIGTETIKNEEVIDINKEWLKSKENAE